MTLHRVLSILGGGFGGLYAAKVLKREPAEARVLLARDRRQRVISSTPLKELSDAPRTTQGVTI